MNMKEIEMFELRIDPERISKKSKYAIKVEFAPKKAY